MLTIPVVNPPGSTTTGLSIFVSVAEQRVGSDSISVVSVTDSKGNVYAVDASKAPMGGGSGGSVYAISAHGAVALAAGDTITVTFSAQTAAHNLAGTAEEWSGLVGTGALDQSESNNGTSTSPSPGTGLTTTVANEVLFVVVGAWGTWNASGPSFLAGGMYTAGGTAHGSLVGGFQAGVFTEYQVVSSTGSYLASSTLTNQNGWAAIQVTYKAADATPAFVGVGSLNVSIPVSPAFVGVGILSVGIPAQATGFTGVGVLSAVGGASNLAFPAFTGVGRLRLGLVYNLWTDLGLLWGRMRNYGTFAAANVVQDLLKIENGYLARPDIEGLYATYQGIGATFTGLRQALASYCDVRLLDRERVLRQLQLPDGSGVDDVLEALGRRMLADGMTLNRSTVTLGAVQAGSNAGTGMLLATKILDGVTAPGLSFPAHSFYNGLASELAVASETMTLVCVRDSEQDGLEPGQEQFSWDGDLPGDSLTWDREGSGQGPTVTAAGASSILTGGDMQDWSANVPNGWTLDSGTAGVHVFQDQSVVYHGLSSLRMTGDGATTIQLSQAPSGLNNRQRYAILLYLMASGQPGGVAFTAGFHGTGYTPANGEFVAVVGSVFPTAWALQSAWLNVPVFTAADWLFVLKLTGMPIGVSLWVDWVIVREPAYHGGIGAVVPPGAVPFLRDDSFAFAVGNDQAGVFQELFRRRYRSQLPSAASPTVADSLAS